MDRQVDLLDLLVNRALHTGTYCTHMHAHTPAASIENDEWGEVGNAAQ